MKKMRMKKLVSLLTAVVLCFGMSMTTFANDSLDSVKVIPTTSGGTSEDRYLVENRATPEVLPKIAAAAELAMMEQLAIPHTANVEIIAAGDYSLYDKNGVSIQDGAVPTGNETFYFAIPDGEDTTAYAHGKPIYVTHECSPGTWEIIGGQIVRTADGWRMAVCMNSFSPVAFFKIVSDGNIIGVTYNDGKPISAGSSVMPPVQTTNGGASEARYLVENRATPEDLQKIATGAKEAMLEQLTIPQTADVKLIAAGDYQLRNAKGELIASGIVPNGGETFYFDLPAGEDATGYKAGKPIYAIHEYTPGKWEIIQGRIINENDSGVFKMEVKMENFSPIAFFMVTSEDGMAEVTYKDGKSIPTAGTVNLPFADAGQGAWYYEPTVFVFSKGLMTGMSSTSFGADVALSRSHFATILYRMAKTPEVAYDAKAFPDVAEKEFFTSPAIWAKSVGVITGYEDGRFGPADEITREQMAVMMYRYAKMLNLDISARGKLDSFPDGSSVSEFAKEAMEWAVGVELIRGKEGKLDPQGKAERAQCATVIMRYVEKYEL